MQMYDDKLQEILLKEAEKETFNENEEKQMKKLQDTILIDMYLDKKIREKLNISDDELKTFFDQNNQRYTVEKAVKVDTIYLTDKAKAKEILKKVTKENFESLKKENDKKADKSEVAWLGLSRIRPEIRERVLTLKSGEIDSTLLEANDGYHIIYLLEDKNEHIGSFDEVKDAAKAELMGLKYQQEKINTINDILAKDKNLSN